MSAGIDLSGVTGLPLWLGNDGLLSIPHELCEHPPSVRSLEAVRPVLYDPGATGPSDLYYMYRDICLPEHRKQIQSSGLRFDMTILIPGCIGSEYVKTVGHYHPPMPGSTETYGEIYQVIYGRALYLLQKVDHSNMAILDVQLVSAEPGDTVIIPSGYGHITINLGSVPLVMANWVDHSFSSNYEPIIRSRGGAYYVLNVGNGSKYVVNGEYIGADPVPKVFSTADYQPSFSLSVPLYQAFFEDRLLIEALARPVVPSMAGRHSESA